MIGKIISFISKSDMFINKHISALVKFCFLQLCDFHHICSFISKTAAMTLANIFVHFRLDYCNNLFYGLPKYFIHCLQKIQNTTACMVTPTSYFSQIRPFLKSLHWLFVFYCINFKIFCLPFCAFSLGKQYYLCSLLANRLNYQSLNSSPFNSLIVPCFKNVYIGIRSFSLLHLFFGIIYLILFILLLLIYLRKNFKTYLFNQAFPS